MNFLKNICLHCKLRNLLSAGPIAIARKVCFSSVVEDNASMLLTGQITRKSEAPEDK